MLALTPTPLQTAGERALFAELARWDTGGAVRSAVVASLPFSDGALNRRLSDAVLIVPEGLAVLRIVEVVRQSGVVTARPEGAWTIGPGAGPGDVLQLAGGGSTPLDGLMRAGMEAAVRLRRAGLEPGRIARVTVLVGELTGLVPEDGDLGEGDQVALLEPRSLLLGIARASRYSGVDNLRLWTTADVRAALEALGLEGRGPTVEELNGEGFPYSPYVLRRPELLAPAAMTAASTAAPAPSPVAAAVAAAAASGTLGEPATPADPPPFAVPAHPTAARSAAPVAPAPVVPEPAAPAPVAPEPVAPAPVALASVTATAPAYSPRPSADPFAGGSTRDTVALGGLPEPPGDETGGIGGLFASGEPLDAQQDEPGVRSTAVLPATPSPMPAALSPRVPPRVSPRVSPRISLPADLPASLRALAAGRRTALLIGGAVLAVLLVVITGVLLLTSGGADGQAATAAPATGPAAPSTPAGPRVGAVQRIGGVPYRLEAVQVDDTCVGHAYGDVSDFFERSNCAGLARALYSADLDGKRIVAAVSRVTMPNRNAAKRLRALADRSGSGNVSDLLREGVAYSGAPNRLHDAEYASAVDGPVVTIVETSWSKSAPKGKTSALDAAASSGLALALPPVPAA